ncbi:MAG: hypothetical protein KBT03_13495, partial [Bacteroidales bacterium]|nr:hypothetical protein [Candidatus Scybalousia scybalohippi]
INIKDNAEYDSKEYKEDVQRVNKFLQNFDAKQEFRNATKNMLLNDTYFCWLRDSEGSFDDEAIDLSNEDGIVEKRSSSFALQTMPQKFCKITGEFTSKNLKGKSYLWDFNLNYFTNPNVNILNYDPSLIKSFNENKATDELKSYIVGNQKELDKINRYTMNSFVRTKVNNGAWVFKYDSSNANTVPPFAYLLKSVFNDDVVERLQKDKDIISANAIILGEMKTRDKENVGNNKNAFTIDPKQVGALMKLARNGINKNIKQIALPLEETRLYQFADNNSNMYKNTLGSNAGLGAHNGAIIFSTEKLAQEEAQIASTIDYESIAKSVYPQFENFLNFFINKKTKKYKFRFTVKGSTLPFLRQKDIDNHMKFMDKGIQIPPQRIGTLLGYEMEEFECLMKEAKYGSMQEDMFMLMNINTANSSNPSSQAGAPQKDVSDLQEGTRDYQ